MMVVAIGAILAMVAVPSFRDMLNTTRQSSALGLIVSDLNLARGEAIKRNTSLIVCARDAAGTGCAGDWRAGWVVCIEGVVNQCAPGTAASPNPLVVRSALDANLTLSLFDALGNAFAFPVRFSPTSAQTSQSDLLVRVGEVRLRLAGIWTGAPTRTVSVAVTGNISRQ